MSEILEGFGESKRINMISSDEIDVQIRSRCSKLVECRICHDDDEEPNVETPCSCRGSLKYAHRKCVQRWCDEKGDIICEICHTQFEPDYTAPIIPLFPYGGVPMNLGRDLFSPHFISTVHNSDREYVDTDSDDYVYPPISPRSLVFCRVVAIIFMGLLVLRYALPILLSGGGDYSMTLFTLLMVRTIGVLLPICVMVKAFTVIQRRRHRPQASSFPLASSDEESDFPHPRPPSLQIR